MLVIKEIEWELVLPIWTNKLWPGRKSEIKPTNGLILKGGFDKSIELNTPTFFGSFINTELVGVISGFKTGPIRLSDKDEISYRSRGLYVEPEHRRKGLASILLAAIHSKAILEKCTLIWTIPRESALPTYKKAGFIQISDFFDDDFEFGPNCYAVKYIGGGR